jgi:hypothetical protein
VLKGLGRPICLKTSPESEPFPEMFFAQCAERVADTPNQVSHSFVNPAGDSMPGRGHGVFGFSQ